MSSEATMNTDVDSGLSAKRPADKLLDSITAGIRRRVKAGKQNGELFARDAVGWRSRVRSISRTIESVVDVAASDQELLDMACALAAAAYFACVPMDAP